MKTFACLALVSLAGTTLAAQDAIGVTLKAGVIRPQEDLIRLTRESRGYFGEVSYRWNLNPEGFAFRAHAGYTRVTRGEDVTTTSALASDAVDYRNYYGGTDLVHPFKLWSQNFDYYLGLTLNSQNFTRRTAGVIPDRTWKVGYRTGITYKINAKWGVDVHYGQSEGPRYVPRLAENNNGSAVRRNPSWLGFAATYTF